MVSSASVYQSLSKRLGGEPEQANPPPQTSRGDGHVNRTHSRTLEEPDRRPRRHPWQGELGLRAQGLKLRCLS